MTNIFFPLVYSVTIYWIIGYQNTAEKFFIYLSGTVLVDIRLLRLREFYPIHAFCLAGR